MNNTENNERRQWNTMRSFSIQVIEILSIVVENVSQAIFEEILENNLPKLMINLYTQVQEAIQTPSRITPSLSLPTHTHTVR